MRRLAISLLLSVCCGCASFCDAFFNSMIESAIDNDDDDDRREEDNVEPAKRDDVRFERSPEGLNENRDSIPARSRDSN